MKNSKTERIRYTQQINILCVLGFIKLNYIKFQCVFSIIMYKYRDVRTDCATTRKTAPTTT